MPAAALATIAKARLIKRALAALVVVVPVGMAALLGGTSILVAQLAGTSTLCTSAPQEAAFVRTGLATNNAAEQRRWDLDCSGA
ncbi:hypothetical protein [Arthrobacter psychrolactophilus]